MMPLPGVLSQQRPYEMFNATQTAKDDLLFMSMMDPLFLFLLSVAGSRRIFFLR